MKIHENFSLKKFNTFNVNVFTKYFVRIKSIDDLKKIIDEDVFLKNEKFILGAGSNILFTKDFDGIILKNEIKGKKILMEDNEHIWIKVSSGENWIKFVDWANEKKYSGIENLACIPGTIGASVIQNIGAYGQSVENTIEEITAIHLLTGEITKFSKEDCTFEYRKSIFKGILYKKYFILDVTFKLAKIFKINLEYSTLKKEIEEKGIEIKNPKDISKIICSIRSEKLPNWKKFGSAGSFFKNAIIYPKIFRPILEKYPNLPFEVIEKNRKYKIPSAWLIDKCNWKGKIENNVGVWKNQPLIITNYGNAKGEYIKKFAEKVKKTVKEKFNIDLEEEVVII